MCGIFCLFFHGANEDSLDKINSYLEKVYKKCSTNINRRGPDSSKSIHAKIDDWHILLASSVLWLQGSTLVEQPVNNEISYFLYNGDIFNSEILPDNDRNQQGDTLLLLTALENSDSIIETLQKVQGPYAFIYLDKRTSKLYFGRDIYGRRSLLIGKNENKLFLSSVAVRNLEIDLIELPALGLFCLDLNETDLHLSLFPWRDENVNFVLQLSKLKNDISLEIDIINNTIGLSNLVSFKPPTENDLVLLKSIDYLKSEEIFTCLLKSECWRNNVIKLETYLESAIDKRVENQPQFCNFCIKERLKCNHALIGILFSGGVDCAIITLIADKFINKSRPIDLLNVAFEKGNHYETPDRKTARQTLSELQQLRPDRKWNLVEINIAHDELNELRCSRIADLISPLNTILDDSLGCALWFASRGKTEDYVSPSRVLFVGMGADELFGGYGRHRVCFKTGGWTKLAQELNNEWRNISHRNLGRDDRVVSDHGRQLRTPYLDENVVEFVKNLKVWERCYLNDSVEQGIGDKLLLRTLAFHLGLKQAAKLRKRALQFGSRIANNKENAHEISPRL